jgi:hypothetical protein
MSWRDRITQAVIERMRGNMPHRPDVVPPGHYDPATPLAQQYQIDAIQRAETMLNDAKGDRMRAAEQALQGLQTPHPVAREQIRREGTLGVLQSEEPLQQWWNIPTGIGQ